MLWNCLSHPWRNHFSCFFFSFCFFVCQFVCLLVCFWLLLSSFVTFFANRKEEEWHMAIRGELWHLKSKLRGFTILGRSNLIRSPQWPTIDQSIEVHYCLVWFKQVQLVFSVLGLHWVLFVFLLRCPHAERSDDAHSLECSEKRFVLRTEKSRHEWNSFWFTSCSSFISLFLPGN